MTANSPAVRALRARDAELTDQLVAGLHSSTALHYRDRDLAAVVSALGRVSGVIGHGKDALAQVYLEAATAWRGQPQQPRRPDELSRGTDTALYAE